MRSRLINIFILIMTLLSFGLGLGATSWGLRSLVARGPYPGMPQIDHLRKKGNDYDVIAIGPSFIRLHFIPPLFDKELRHKKYEITSFNFGAKGLRGTEMDFYIGRILDMRLSRLKWLIIDVTLQQLRKVPRGNWYKRRIIDGHGPRQYALLAHEAFRHGVSWDGVALMRSPTEHLLLDLINAGRGLDYLETVSWPGTRERFSARTRFFRGEWAKKGNRVLGARYAEKHGKSHRKAAKKLALARERPCRSPRENSLMVHWRAEAREHGVNVLLSPFGRVKTPTFRWQLQQETCRGYT
jgi:hypothetical protein